MTAFSKIGTQATTLTINHRHPHELPTPTLRCSADFLTHAVFSCPPSVYPSQQSSISTLAELKFWLALDRMPPVTAGSIDGLLINNSLSDNPSPDNLRRVDNV